MIADEEGFFEDPGFKVKCNKELNYSIVWDRHDFEIRSNNYGQAKYVEKNVTECLWNVDFTREKPNQFLYSHVFRGAWYYYYKNTFSVSSPPGNALFGGGKMSLGVRNKKNAGNRFTPHYFQFNRDLLIPGTGIKLNGSEIKMPLHIDRLGFQIFGATIHELTHASHWARGMTYLAYCNPSNYSGRLAESWAEGVEWHVNNVIYDFDSDAGLSHTLSYIQGKSTCLSNGSWYTPLFIDLMDTSNQGASNPAYANDQASGFSIGELESYIIQSPKKWFEVRDHIQNSSNPTKTQAAELFDLYIPQD